MRATAAKKSTGGCSKAPSNYGRLLLAVMVAAGASSNKTGQEENLISAVGKQCTLERVPYGYQPRSCAAAACRPVMLLSTNTPALMSCVRAQSCDARAHSPSATASCSLAGLLVSARASRHGSTAATGRTTLSPRHRGPSPSMRALVGSARSGTGCS